MLAPRSVATLIYLCQFALCGWLLAGVQVASAQDLPSEARWRLGSLEANAEDGHQGGIYQVACSRDGNWIATRGSDRTVRLWQQGKTKHVLKHEGSIKAMAFSWDSQFLLTGSRDQTQIWKVKSGEVVQTLARGVSVAKFRPNSQTLMAVFRDRIQRIDFAEDKLLEEVSGPSYAMDFSPDGKILAAIPRYGDHTIRLHSAETGEQLRSLTGSEGYPVGLTFSPQGHTLASGGRDEKVRCWEVATGKELFVLAGHEGPVQAVAFSADGSRLASGGWDHVVRVWDVETAKQVKGFAGHEDIVTSLAFSPDGRWLVSGSLDKTALVWSLGENAKSYPPLKPKEIERLWQALASDEANSAYQAIAELRHRPKSTVAFLRRQLGAYSLPNTKTEYLDLIADLDAEDFHIREQATQTLLKLRMRERIAPLLTKLLEDDSLSLEQAARIKRVLRAKEILPVTPEQQRQFLRAVQLLERIGNESAAELLAIFETQIPDVEINQAAAAALERLGSVR